MAAYQSILQKFVADEVDLIFVFPTEASLVAKATTQETNIPVVFAHSLLEGSDLVNSIREPGGNITGVRFPGPDMAVKRLEIFHQLAPQVKRMLIPYQQGYPIVASQLEALRPAAEAAGITLVELPVNNAAELEADLQARMKSDDIGFEAVLCIIEPVLTTPDALAVLGRFSAESKVPFGGCPMMSDSYTSVFETRLDNVAVGEQAAILADKTFKGASAGTIPVISPEVYLGLNYKMAQELGLTIPEGLLRQAAQVIR
jgi:putative ABC transport system substrate-binding protein